MRFLAIVVVALTMCTTVATAAKPAKRANLPQLARTLVKSGSPGAIVYVRTPTATRSGAAGFADVGAHVTMHAGDRYRIASVTKAFVSVVILQLEAEGKLDIDDSVEKWLPGVVPNGSAISLRKLMNHTSGLFDYLADPGFVDELFAEPTRLWQPLELLSHGLKHATLFAPGANWSYSNTNYILLGLVAEAAGGKPLGQLLEERIFGPLALAATSFPLTIALDSTFVHGYASLDGSTLIDATPLVNPSLAWAAGGIVSNAGDVTTFYRGLFTGRLLPPIQLREMKAPAPFSGTYGLGIDFTYTACGRAYGHIGGLPGWVNEVLSTADGKRQAVVMVNVDGSRAAPRSIGAFVRRALCRG